MSKSMGRQDFSSGGAAPPPKGKKKEGGKLVFAIILLVVAGAVVAFTQGWFGGKKDPGTGLSAEENAAQDKAFEKAKETTQQKIKSGHTSPPAGS